MSTPAASNQECSDRAGSLKTLLNSSHNLRLFTNNITPDPATPSTLGGFTEATFTGYSAQSLAGVWGSVYKVKDGEYAFDSSTITFTCTGGSSQVIYGWYIDDGSHWKFAAAFPSSITIAPGNSITLLLSPQNWSYSVTP